LGDGRAKAERTPRRVSEGFSEPLPIDEALPALRDALRDSRRAVLVAPPGAGKTTRVPLALLDEPWTQEGKILVLEPRRLAARGAAARMADTLGEAVGARVGLRVRMGSKVSGATRIEVVTEGVFTRMIVDDPELTGVAAVLFDEFHERSLDADLGLALALDAQAGLREDLRILVMSATLDGARVASLLDEAPVIESQGRAYPVETRYVGRDPRRRIEEEITDIILRIHRTERGSMLVFLPGQGEIRRVEHWLAERLDDASTDIAPLFGAMDQRAQDLAVQPAASGRRKIVLATSIAETSLTIEGVRIVIDSGLQRVPRFEPDIGLTRLETVRVSRASADQRRGRAGRTEPGIAYRLWEEAGNGALEAFGKPEILSADVSSLLLDCAAWGVSDLKTLRFLDYPPQAAVSEAKKLLQGIHALDAEGRMTPEGKAIRALPLPPRLARMVLAAGEQGAMEQAAEIAALLTERGLGGSSVDLDEQLQRFQRDRSPRAEEMRRLIRGWIKGLKNSDRRDAPSTGAILALAYPDRVAVARGKPGNLVMVNGRAAALEPHESLAREPYLVIAEVQGQAASARILLAAALTEAELHAQFQADMAETSEVSFDAPSASLRARRVKRLGSLVLSERVEAVEASEETARLLAKGMAGLGMARWPLSAPTQQWLERVRFLRRSDPAWPDLSDKTLEAEAENWLAPYLLGKTSLNDIGADRLREALESLLDWSMARRLDEEAPTHFLAPTGNRHPIDYESGQGPVLTIRVQELYGLKDHPSVARGKWPLVLHLTSPAHRPIQITKDLPGFWRGSWGAVKSEMKGRYPKHPWPDDPANALPTARAKPRGT
jgi:ATP-dependent helicase HrpB